MASPEEIARIRKLMADMSPEQREQLKQMAGDQRRRADLPIKDEQGKTLAFPHMPIMRTENLDPSTVEGKVNTGFLAASGLGSLARGAAAAAQAGGNALTRFGLARVGNAAVGAGVGGALGATNLPIVGGQGLVEGAKFGAIVGAGGGGAGALWKHGKKKKLIDYLTKKIGSGAGQGGAAAKTAKEIVDDLPANFTGTPVASVPQAIPAATPKVSDVARAAARGPSKPLGSRTPDFGSSLTGRKAKRAWLESRGKIPGAMGPDDVAALKAKGYTPEEIETALIQAAKPNKGVGWKPSPKAGEKGKNWKPEPTPLAPRAAAAKQSPKAQVDQRFREAQEGLQHKIRQVEEAGNLKTFQQGQKSARKGYEQRDIVEDYVNGIEIDPNAEYVLNYSKVKGLSAQLRKRVERELLEEAGEGAAALALPKSLSQEQVGLVHQLQGLYKVKGNRGPLKQVAKETFGDDFKAVWDFILSPQTRM